MTIQVHAARRLLANQLSPLEQACDWIVQYTWQSSEFSHKFLAPSFVDQHLSPLYELVPRPKPLSGLFHCVGAKHKVEIGKTFRFPSRKLVSSWTSLNKPKQWLELAEEVGIDSHEWAYVVQAQQALYPFTSPGWLLEVQKKLKTLGKESRRVRQFLELDPKYQREYICEAKTDINVVCIHAIVES